ncbi:hypothetical protein EON77_17980, partial [bacterium]
MDTRVDPATFRALKERLLSARRVLIGTHLNPDGDALGSALAFSLWLDGLGVSNEVLDHHDAPRNLRFLPGIDRIRTTPSEPADFGVVLDLDATHRLGSTQPYFDAIPFALIDHHIPHESPGEIRIVHTDAAATALIVARMLSENGETITAEMATCLYTGIVTDTGSFRFRNTSSEALSTAAMLLERGADFVTVSEHVFQSRRLSSARLLGRLLDGMSLEEEGRLAWGSVSTEDFAAAEAGDDDTEGFVNELLAIDTVQVAALLREVRPGVVRGSIRSRGTVDV